MNLQETIKESLGCMNLNCDQNTFTREYNNIYSLFSNTHAEVVCGECNLMIIRGSEFRKSTNTLMDGWFYRIIDNKSVASLLDKYNYTLLDWQGETFFSGLMTSEPEEVQILKPELLDIISQKVKDSDYVIVTSIDNLM